jgi:EAL domain-containing protein (putative c-di-GMP-specific phosphodiesterase class I)
MIHQRVELEFDLRSALRNAEFRLVYQPIYDVGALELLGAEALLRWEHPTLGEIQPETFIPILERTGQIVEVGRWVLGEACNEAAEWQRHGVELGISVNVSGRQFDDGSIVADVAAALGSSGLRPASLTIEMTESAVMRNHIATASHLAEIKRLGVRIAIDDFGTGYSSFAYLREFPIDSLKIDRSFTNAITSSEESRALVRTLVQIGKDLHMTTIAEGVETSEQMDQLRLDHVDEAQGYLLARPLTPEVFRDTLVLRAAPA